MFLPGRWEDLGCSVKTHTRRKVISDLGRTYRLGSPGPRAATGGRSKEKSRPNHPLGAPGDMHTRSSAVFWPQEGGPMIWFRSKNAEYLRNPLQKPRFLGIFGVARARGRGRLFLAGYRYPQRGPIKLTKPKKKFKNPSEPS